MPTMNRRAAKRDTAEGPIVKALVDAGCSIQRLSDKGVCDLLVAYPTRRDTGDIVYHTVLMEVKTGNAKLTPDEERFIASWKGRIYIVRTPQDALDALGL